MKTSIRALTVILMSFLAQPSYAWSDMSHIAIAKAAGYQHWYNAAGADVAKIKASKRESKNHYFNNSPNKPVTSAMVMEQVGAYNSSEDEDGHLYGAIIASMREYKNQVAADKFAEHHMAYVVHYVGDLSQPLHNIAYDSYNRAHHLRNDGIVEKNVLENIKEIEKNMYEIKLGKDTFEEDLSREIARIAEQSRQLGLKLRSEDADMSEDEAYVQMGHSASLLKALLESVASAK